MAYNHVTYHFRVEDPSNLLGAYVSRVKGKGLLEPESGVYRKLSGTAGLFSSQEDSFLGRFFIF